MGSDKIEWKVGLTDDANSELAELPTEEAKKVLQVVEEMENSSSPYNGASKLKYTKPYVVWRRRKGRLRILFQVSKAKAQIKILRIDLRNDDTYTDVLGDADESFAD